MLKIKFGAKWTAIVIATLMMGLDPLAAGATIVQATNLTELAGQNPVVIARADRPTKKKAKKSKSRKRRLKSTSDSVTSVAESEKFWNVYRVGSNSVSGCISEGKALDCERLANSRSSLTNWCLQGKTEACDRLDGLSGDENYERISDVLRKAV